MRWVAGLFLGVLALAGAAAHADERWLRAESARFIVYGEDGEEKLVAAVRDLEALDGLLRRMSATTAPPSPVRLEVYLFDGRNRIRIVRPGMSQDVAGFYTAQPDLIAAFNDYSEASTRGDIDGRHVLYHEYAHHFMLQYFNNAYPAWYVEGFAEYAGAVKFPPGRIEIGRVPPFRADWLSGGGWLPIGDFLNGRRSNSDEVSQFYAQSWLAVHFLINRPERMAGFLRYVAALRDGGDPVTAFAPASGVTPEAFEAELKRYKRTAVPAVALTKPAAVETAPVTVTRLPASANELLLHAARMRTRPDAEGLGIVRTIAARFPGDAFAQRTLALAYIKAGDPAAAAPLLDALLARVPDDAETLYLKGLALLTQAEKPGADVDALLAQARPLLGRSNRLAPDNPHTLYRYAESTRGQPGVSAESSLNVLLLAQQLAPQVSAYRLNAASALMAYERYDEAVVMLRPVAFDPHGGSGARTARSMLDAARARQPWSGPQADDEGEE